MFMIKIATHGLGIHSYRTMNMCVINEIINWLSLEADIEMRDLRQGV